MKALNASSRVRTAWTVVVLVALFVPARTSAQTAATKGETAAQSSPADAVPLGRFVPKDNLLLYFEFAGLNAHDEAWRKTAACKMLYDTPLGGMLGEVASQLLDRALAFVPERKLTGADIVALVENAAKSGFVMAVHINPKETDKNDLIRTTFVLRGAASKSSRATSARLLGLVMGPGAKPKIEFRDSRSIVFVPFGGVPTNPGWAWWAEKSDLVVVSHFPGGAEATLATLAGKSPSAVDHPIVQELSKPEGTFHPACIAFADVAGCPETPAKLTEFFRELNQRGLSRMDVRWGFDEDALMTITRLVAPKPRKPIFAVFDQPTFEKTSMVPLPDGVDSFVELSMNPSLVFEAIKGLGLPDSAKAQLDEFTEQIQSAGKVDLQKDLLAHLGPKVALYLAPGRSAATTNEESSLESVLGNGLNPMAAASAALTAFPKLTVIAEVKDPVEFGKALDAVIIAINNELKAQAIEKASHEEEAKGDQAPAAGGARPGGGRMAGGRPGGGSEKSKRRRLEDTPAPHFQATPGEKNSYVLTTPSASPLRFGPPTFRPSIHLEGNYLAFSVASGAAREALLAVKKKNWTPSAAIVKGIEHVPPKLTFLMLNDMAETLSSLLANLPGTLQTSINTSIALSRNPGSPGSPGAAPSNPATQPNMMNSGPRRGGRGGTGPGAGGGGAPSAGAPTPAGNGSTEAGMIQFNIDADKLPKAEDLKEHLFPSTLSVTVSDQDIRFVSRAAFPNLSSPFGVGALAVMMPALKSYTAGLATPPPASPAAATNPTPAVTPPVAPGRGRPGGRPGGGRRGEG